MTREEIIDNLNSTIDAAITKVNGGIPAIQRQLFDEIADLIRNLDYDGNKISPSVANLRIIGAIENKLRKIILNTGYQEDIKTYLSTFNTVSTLQNQYMRSISNDFTVSALLKNIKLQSIGDTATSLTEEGLTANVIQSIKDVLRTNITTGGTFNQLLSQARELILNTDSGDGILEKHVKQITTDAINQYSRNYLQNASRGLGLDGWYQYTGSNLKTSRDFCLAMTKKRYFNVREIPDLLKGDFDEFKQIGGKIYDKTGLPQGMIAGTNTANFLTFLGGYQCGHRAIPIPTSLVPQSVIDDFRSRYPE